MAARPAAPAALHRGRRCGLQIAGHLKIHTVFAGQQLGTNPHWAKRWCVLSAATPALYLFTGQEQRNLVDEPGRDVSVVHVDASRGSTPHLIRRHFEEAEEHEEKEDLWPDLFEQLVKLGSIEHVRGSLEDARQQVQPLCPETCLIDGFPCVMDLSNQPLSARAVHPSVFGDDRYFQVETPDFICFCACAHKRARDLWLSGFYACRDARKQAYVSHDLSVELFKARHLSNKGWFHCEIHIRGVLFGQTSTTAAEGGSSMWRSKFFFSDVPEFLDEITVVLYENRKQQNRHIGQFNTNLSNLDGICSDPEKEGDWVALSTSKRSFFRRLSEAPQLQLRVHNTRVYVLEGKQYLPVLKALVPHVDKLCDELRSFENQDWLRPLARVLRVVGGMEKVLTTLVQHETSKELSLVLRQSNTATRVFSAYMCLAARDFLVQALQKTIDSAYLTTRNMVLDGDASSKETLRNQAAILQEAESMWRNIMAALVHLPQDVRTTLSHLEAEFSKAGRTPELSRRIVFRLLFLYFLLPALLTPWAPEYQLALSEPQPRVRSCLKALSKILQKLSSGMYFEADDPMSFANPFLEEATESVDGFMTSLLSASSELSVTRVPLSPSARELAVLTTALGSLQPLEGLASKHTFVQQLLDATRLCRNAQTKLQLTNGFDGFVPPPEERPIGSLHRASMGDVTVQLQDEADEARPRSRTQPAVSLSEHFVPLRTISEV